MSRNVCTSICCCQNCVCLDGQDIGSIVLDYLANIDISSNKKQKDKPEKHVQAQNNTSLAKIAYPAIQIFPTFSSTFKIAFNNRKMKCLICCTMDQDRYFQLARDVSPKLNEYKCSTLYSKTLSGIKTRLDDDNSNYNYNYKMNASLRVRTVVIILIITKMNQHM